MGILFDSSCPFVPLKAYQLVNYQKIYILGYVWIVLSHKFFILKFFVFRYKCLEGIFVNFSTTLLILQYIFKVTELLVYFWYLVLEYHEIIVKKTA